MIVGLLLAAGSGRRFGKPKALVDTGDGPWVVRSLSTLAETDRQLVVVGASADTVAGLLPEGVAVVINAEHAEGMGTSLRAGLAVLAADPVVDAAVVMLVDLPDVPLAAVRRVVAFWREAGSPRSMLARAGYRGLPGHPVLIGGDHFTGVIGSAVGDRGARDYLASSDVALIECGDLATGDDVDEAGLAR